jgi:c(7)-type cytochrome triheme protein
MRRLVLACLLSAAAAGAAFAFWDLPKSLPPEEFGTVLINRTSSLKGVEPVVFSHWVHRRKHTCRVCHFELEFNFKTNTTEITEAASKGGRFCGAPGCHDGTAVFGHEKPNCEKCHTGKRTVDKKAFAGLGSLPKARYGNGVNWVKALEEGKIKPVTYLTTPPADMSFDRLLNLEAEWSNIPPAIFPHKVHVAWLDCNNCHPDVFNIKKKTTKHFAMVRILKGEFCGVCHLTVAFPMDDCKRCHPRLQERS